MQIHSHVTKTFFGSNKMNSMCMKNYITFSVHGLRDARHATNAITEPTNAPNDVNAYTHTLWSTQNTKPHRKSHTVTTAHNSAPPTHTLNVVNTKHTITQKEPQISNCTVNVITACFMTQIHINTK